LTRLAQDYHTQLEKAVVAIFARHIQEPHFPGLAIQSTFGKRLFGIPPPLCPFPHKCWMLLSWHALRPPMRRHSLLSTDVAIDCATFWRILSNCLFFCLASETLNLSTVRYRSNLIQDEVITLTIGLLTSWWSLLNQKNLEVHCYEDLESLCSSIRIISLHYLLRNPCLWERRNPDRWNTSSWVLLAVDLAAAFRSNNRLEPKPDKSRQQTQICELAIFFERSCRYLKSISF